MKFIIPPLAFLCQIPFSKGTLSLGKATNTFPPQGEEGAGTSGDLKALPSLWKYTRSGDSARRKLG